jgi:DNA invertase Pin-like site-specific DNA recombinase
MTNMRSALYLRVSTTDQTVGNQRVELGAAAAARGRTVVATYAELGITGAAAPDGGSQSVSDHQRATRLADSKLPHAHF